MIYSKTIVDNTKWMDRIPSPNGIIGITDQDVVTTYKLFGIPFYTFKVIVKNTGEFKTEDSNHTGFKFK